MTDILVYIEHQEGKVKNVSLELVSKASELASETGGQVSALVVGSGLSGFAEQLAPYGAKKVFLADDAKLADYNTIAYRSALAHAVKESGAKIVLGTASAIGKDLFPRTAAHLKAGLSSDSTELRIEGGKLLAKRPVYSGKAFVEVQFNTDIQMATSRANSFPIKDPDSSASAEEQKITPEIGELRCALKEKVQGEVGKVDLTEAEIIVSGGRAMANSENFEVLRNFASQIGATVGASRAAVDSGYAPHDMQVGQTGKVVNPKLYIACGISGAIQHLAGMRTSKVIVAINKDPEAPIFSKADYGIVGDLFEVVPLLTEEAKTALAD